MKKGYIFLIAVGIVSFGIVWGFYITDKHNETRRLGRMNDEINRQLEANGIELK